MYYTTRPDGCPCLWHQGSSRKHWAAFHALDGCGLPLSPAQPNHKSSLPGELAALTPALCLPHLGPASCQDGDSDTNSRRDCETKPESGSCLELSRMFFIQIFLFLLSYSFFIVIQDSVILPYPLIPASAFRGFSA
jgi:hypothetical protein